MVWDWELKMGNWDRGLVIGIGDLEWGLGFGTGAG